GLRAEAFQDGAKERNYTFTINEAKRWAEFVKVQQKRKERFDKAEDSRETEFEKAQRQRESEFQNNERKREDDFLKSEVERNDRAREEREERAQNFQWIMSKLQQRCIDNGEGRLKELELLAEELMTSREQGSTLNLRKLPRRSLDRSLWSVVRVSITDRTARMRRQEHTRHELSKLHKYGQSYLRTMPPRQYPGSRKQERERE
ncbi:hypothetical protein C0992_000689, partial [Termitomyces sp. T32_za158]